MGVIGDIERIADDARVAKRRDKLAAAEFEIGFGDKIGGSGGFIGVSQPFGERVVRPPGFRGGIGNRDIA